jgi:putative Mg2+ transporter-C (MgtC) family protein
MDSLEEDLIKLLLAMLLGGLIGAEREYRSKAAGLRTMIMICVGATLITIVSHKISPETGRIAANIVNGIGFMGAGIIFRADNRVQGLTTAAVVWAVSALGMCLGGGYYALALAGFVVVLGSLLLLSGLSSRIGRNRQGRNYRIVAPYQNKTLSHYDAIFAAYGLFVQRGPQTRSGNQIEGQWRVEGPEEAHEKCVRHLLDDPDIKEFSF